MTPVNIMVGKDLHVSHIMTIWQHFLPMLIHLQLTR